SKKLDNSLNPSKIGNPGKASNSSMATKSAKNDLKTTDEGINKSIQKSDAKNNLPRTNNISESPIEVADTAEEQKNKPFETPDSTIDKTKTAPLFNGNKNNKETTIADIKTTPENPEVSKEQLQLSIEEAIELAKNNDEEEKENKNKWSVTPNAAPVFFNSLGKGSSIDPQFNNNSKSSETNLSYGVSASYAVNNRISVRSGINKVNLGYNTNNVVAFQTMGSYSSMSVLQNVKPVLNSAASLS